MSQKALPVIAGPTASGKTAVAVALSQLLGGEIISADSMQVYRHLSIGTAKPTAEELQGIPCHLIDHVSPDDQYHLGRFVNEAQECIKSISDGGKIPVICGGTGLYIRGLIYGVFQGGEPNPEIRQKLEQRKKTEGLGPLYAELLAVDPVLATAYGPTDPQRILRGLEVYHSTGKPLSSLHSQDQDKPLFPARIYVLQLPRSEIYQRINHRVDEMVGRGLAREASDYLAQGFSLTNPAVNALGYKELLEALQADLPLEPALETMKKKSRNYAKRQETWFRSMKHTTWVDCCGKSAKLVAETIATDWEKNHP